MSFFFWFSFFYHVRGSCVKKKPYYAYRVNFAVNTAKYCKATLQLPWFLFPKHWYTPVLTTNNQFIFFGRNHKRVIPQVTQLQSTIFRPVVKLAPNWSIYLWHSKEKVYNCSIYVKVSKQILPPQKKTYKKLLKKLVFQIQPREKFVSNFKNRKKIKIEMKNLIGEQSLMIFFIFRYLL